MVRKHPGVLRSLLRDATRRLAVAVVTLAQAPDSGPRAVGSLQADMRIGSGTSSVRVTEDLASWRGVFAGRPAMDAGEPSMDAFDIRAGLVSVRRGRSLRRVVGVRLQRLPVVATSANVPGVAQNLVMGCEPGTAEAFEWLGLTWADRWLTEIGATTSVLAAVHRSPPWTTCVAWIWPARRSATG
jgi:hypothetical protein